MSVPVLQIVLPGRVVSKQRPRFVRGRATTAPGHRAYLARVVPILRAYWGRRAPLDEPLIAVVICTFHRPQRLQRVKDRGTGRLPFTNAPDADNGAGLPMDALEQAGVVTNDSRIADLIAVNRWAALDSSGRHIGPERTELLLFRWVDWFDEENPGRYLSART